MDAQLRLQGLSLLPFQRPETLTTRAHGGHGVMEPQMLQQAWSVRGWVNVQVKRGGLPLHSVR